mmetsp:Transcript_12296/g.8945  ORF Transcript_12296/g.8945 Transcript_12296/m.8945 type:complete len:86 (+) Transcript_12296:1078-1335(+)
MIVASLFEHTALDGLFNKNMPKDIRATLNAAFNFFGNAGMLLFTKAGGYLYDNAGKQSPFYFVLICDAGFLLLVVALKLAGKINQ